jgi:hypothetical protein
MRRRFDSVVTLPTEDRVVPAPREALDLVDLGYRHLIEQPPRVGRDRLEVSPLRLGVERPERERRLAGARDPGEHDERVARQLDVDVLEVVLAGAAHFDVAERRAREASRPAGRPLAGAWACLCP